MASLTKSDPKSSTTKRRKSKPATAVEGISPFSDINKLISLHQTEIQKLQKLVPPPQNDDPYCKYDDLFYMRYIISFATAEKAQEFVEFTFQKRAEPSFLLLAQEISENKFLSSPACQEAMKWAIVADFDKAMQCPDYSLFIRGSAYNMSMLHDRIPTLELTRLNLGLREHAFQECNRRSR